MCNIFYLILYKYKYSIKNKKILLNKSNNINYNHIGNVVLTKVET